MRAPCRIEGCEKPSRGRGLCATHWLRWRKHGDPNVVLRAGTDYAVTPPCSIDDCDRLAHAQGLCTMHYGRLRRTGNALTVRPREGRPLTSNGPTWVTIHKRLTRARGSASAHPCVDCSEQAEEWSYDGTDPDERVSEVRGVRLRYSLHLDRYAPRCILCHRRFDASQRSA